METRAPFKLIYDNVRLPVNMGQSLKDHLTQCNAQAEMIYGQCVEVSGERRLPAYFTISSGTV